MNAIFLTMDRFRSQETHVHKTKYYKIDEIIRIPTSIMLRLHYKVTASRLVLNISPSVSVVQPVIVEHLNLIGPHAEMPSMCVALVAGVICDRSLGLCCHRSNCVL
jgi:hypothetical protein